MTRNSRLFHRFLISYIVILIIPSFAGYMSYRTSIAVTKQVSIENSITQLQKTEEILERRMMEVEGFVSQLSLNQDLNALIGKQPSDIRSNLYPLWKVMQQISSYSQTNDFLKDFYVFYKDLNLIITPGSVYFRPEHYYQTYSYSDLTFKEWKDVILDKPHHNEIMPLRSYEKSGQATEVITYLQSLPLYSFNNTAPAVIAVVMDHSTIDNLLSSFREQYGGWANISDAQGRAISVQGTDEAELLRMSLDRKFAESATSQFYDGYLIITVRSQTNGWVYRAGIPENVLMDNANKITYISWSIASIALLTGLLAVLFLAYRNSAPINKLLQVMKEQFGKEAGIGRNEYDFLYGNISAILTTNKRLELDLNRQRPLVLDAFLKRLIGGEYQTREQIEAAAMQAGIELGVNQGRVGILQIHGYASMDSVEILNELFTSRLLVKEKMNEIDRHVLLTDLGSDRIVVIFPADADRERIERMIIAVTLFAFEEYRITIKAAIGNPFGTAKEISHSYQQARQTLENGAYAGKNAILWFSESHMELGTYYYPLDTELRLIGTIQAGDIEEAKQIVGSVLSTNVHSRELSLEMRYQLASEIKGTLLKLLDQKGFLEFDSFEKVKNRIVGLPTYDTFHTFQTEIETVMEEMCSQVSSKKKSIRESTVEHLHRFLEENYADPQLNLYMVAQQMNRPEKYISQLYKDVTGNNLFDYLEKLRVDEAAVLLKGDDLSIDEIALKVGYNSSHTFRRAFKRVKGISPSAYRLHAKPISLKKERT